MQIFLMMIASTGGQIPNRVELRRLSERIFTYSTSLDYRF
jgi:hypothetical protein